MRVEKIFILLFGIFVFLNLKCFGQDYPEVEDLKAIKLEKQGIYNYKLEMGTNTFGFPIYIPVIIIQGKTKGPTLGLVAGIHGDELNGISIVHKLVEQIDVYQLKGRIIAIPGINAYAIHQDQRLFIENYDLNRLFPGEKYGNQSQQFVYKITHNILPLFDFLIDMHTASFGRANSMYVRADLENDTLRALAFLQQADIILDTKVASVGEISSRSATLRATASLMGISSITVEYGNPFVYQKEINERGVKGILNSLGWLGMYGKFTFPKVKNQIICQSSFWIYTVEGGFLEVLVELKDYLKKGDKIAQVRNAFGKVIGEYFAPEDGIVISKSTDPTNMNGGRVIQLGIIDK
ncbi:succinylglutamate desuccinylase/aspartoacylase family protein [Xanthovirga aplysinae]|uniref:succinylglutamate desuccinylase/aspartoacylase family protein n=1 Tax=Xanthovirga aplysinae TaxID=2529853 RepID=UPI0012BB58DB|nr:succinylglutamate desuccinylase/aspartoacylase family protein [Xanthovirga aplysinae]MTI30127.1 peptidase M14 [Xanthovirga aplysinae]